MPNRVKNNLDQLIVADMTAAEVNGANRVFVGVGINNLAGQEIKVAGFVYSVFCFDPTDYARLSAAQLFIQRSLTLSENTIFPASEQAEEQLFQFNFREPYARQDHMVRPITLQASYAYAIVLNLIAPAAPVLAAIRLSLTVLGDQVSTSGRQFPLDLR